jgi:hypothetical protein
MMNSGVFQQFGNLFELLKGGKIPMPTISTFAPDRCLPKGSLGEEIVKDQDYFSIEINELYLARDRLWWATYDPVVLIISEFVYGGERIIVPKVVGPSMIESQFGKLPLGIVLNDTRVVGPYPFRGDRIKITIVLYRVRHDSYARELLRLVEQVSSAVGVPADAGVLLKIGSTILDGIESLMGLGDTEPLVGHRIELDGNRLQGLRSSSTVLSTGGQDDLSTLWVDTGRLRTGTVGMSAAPFEAADYVLYTLQRQTSRGEEATLPFYGLYQQAMKSALLTDDNGESWKQAKASLLSLYQQMVVSPDITANEADRLFETYAAELKKKRANAELVSKMAIGDPVQGKAPLPAQRLRLNRAVSVLDLE